MIKIAAIFLALSFAATMFSIPSMIGTANATTSPPPNQQGAESACGEDYTLERGYCVSTKVFPSCFPGRVDEKNPKQCIYQIYHKEQCPEGSIIYGPGKGGLYTCVFKPTCKPYGGDVLVASEDGKKCVKKPGNRVGQQQRVD